MNILRKFYTVIKNVNRAYTLITEQDALTAKRLRMLLELKEMSLVMTCGTSLRYLGNALSLARTYGILLEEGFSPAQCKASFPKEQWEHPIDPTVDPSEYGVLSYFLITDVPAIVEGTLSIDAYADSVQEAVVRCLMYARKAGVI